MGVRGLVVDHAGCFAREVGVVVIEAILDELRMFVVARKDHGLANAVAVAAGAALGHQHFEALINGVGVEQPAVQCT